MYDQLCMQNTRTGTGIKLVLPEPGTGTFCRHWYGMFLLYVRVVSRIGVNEAIINPKDRDNIFI